MNKKKKIFLAGYINSINAQNINCKSIAYYLDKNKYQVMTLVFSHLTPIHDINDIRIISVPRYFHRFFSFFSYLFGIIWADVAYFPKHQSTPRVLLMLAPYLRTKMFTTIERNMCDDRFESMIDSFGSKKNMIDYFRLIPNIFGITEHIIKSSNCGVRLYKYPLFLGVDYDLFSNDSSRSFLKNIVSVCNLFESKRERMLQFINLAKKFSNLNFHIIGDGPDKEMLQNVATENVIFYGRRTHEEYTKIFKNMDLHILLSRSEGFPKTILETAASSIPSLVYSDYGANEWISHDVNGFVVQDYNQVISKIDDLLNNSDLLHQVSCSTSLIAKDFDWRVIIKSWEKAIDNLI